METGDTSNTCPPSGEEVVGTSTAVVPVEVLETREGAAAGDTSSVPRVQGSRGATLPCSQCAVQVARDAMFTCVTCRWMVCDSCCNLHGRQNHEGLDPAGENTTVCTEHLHIKVL